MNAKKKRADELMIEQRLAKDLKEARALIMAGKVVAGEQRVEKPSDRFSTSLSLRLKAQGRYVSRGGEKLAGAIKQLGLHDEFSQVVALDIGASTGGFTHCLLELGAKKVIALDVGSNQLAWSLRQDPRVDSLEQTDIRTFQPSLYGPIDWIVADISFNSVVRLAFEIVRAGQAGCRYLILIKPQFELAAEEIPRGGVVTDQALIEKAVARAVQVFAKLGLEIYAWLDSPLKGRKGNQEVFLYMGKK